MGFFLELDSYTLPSGTFRTFGSEVDHLSDYFAVSYCRIRGPQCFICPFLHQSSHLLRAYSVVMHTWLICVHSCTKLPTESCVLWRLAVLGLNHHMWQIVFLELWQLTLGSDHSQGIQEFNYKSHFSYYLVKAVRVGSVDLRLFNWTTLNRAE